MSATHTYTHTTVCHIFIWHLTGQGGCFLCVFWFWLVSATVRPKRIFGRVCLEMRIRVGLILRLPIYFCHECQSVVQWLYAKAGVYQWQRPTSTAIRLHSDDVSIRPNANNFDLIVICDQFTGTNATANFLTPLSYSHCLLSPILSLLV